VKNSFQEGNSDFIIRIREKVRINIVIKRIFTKTGFGSENEIEIGKANLFFF
jgi:hypothetical protein